VPVLVAVGEFRAWLVDVAGDLCQLPPAQVVDCQKDSIGSLVNTERSGKTLHDHG
jgi:hypothetical protein